MVAQTSISPRTVTATLTNGTAYNQQVTAYNSSIAYNQPTATNGSVVSRIVSVASASPRTVPGSLVSPRAVATASASPRVTSSASMKAR